MKPRVLPRGRVETMQRNSQEYLRNAAVKRESFLGVTAKARKPVVLPRGLGASAARVETSKPMVGGAVYLRSSENRVMEQIEMPSMRARAVAPSVRGVEVERSAARGASGMVGRPTAQPMGLETAKVAVEGAEKPVLETKVKERGVTMPELNLTAGDEVITKKKKKGRKRKAETGGEVPPDLACAEK